MVSVHLIVRQSHTTKVWSWRSLLTLNIQTRLSESSPTRAENSGHARANHLYYTPLQTSSLPLHLQTQHTHTHCVCETLTQTSHNNKFLLVQWHQQHPFWKMSWTSWSQRSGTWISWRCGGHSLSLTISLLCKMETLQRSSRSLKALTMSSTTAMTSTGSLAPRPIASPSRTLHAVALATWSPKRSTSTPLMMTALWVFF